MTTPIGSSSSSNPNNHDWCGSDGSGFVPDGGFGVDWSDACREHDECYATPDASKDLCDYNLQENMSLACEAQDGGILCQLTAGLYYQGVHLFGGPAYERAQGNAEDK